MMTESELYRLAGSLVAEYEKEAVLKSLRATATVLVQRRDVGGMMALKRLLEVIVELTDEEPAEGGYRH